MKCFVNTYNEIEGFHQWKDAHEWCSYLRSRHRHLFVIRCSFEVTDKDRELEINRQQAEIEDFLLKKYGKPMELGGMSCEMIAEVLLNHFEQMSIATVMEDGYGGATLSK